VLNAVVLLYVFIVNILNHRKDMLNPLIKKLDVVLDAFIIFIQMTKFLEDLK
jgi:hypothetical protein